ncbi:hypothetical protein ACFPRL_30605 [Pseudoclavibacter helvolus]
MDRANRPRRRGRFRHQAPSFSAIRWRMPPFFASLRSLITPRTMYEPFASRASSDTAEISASFMRTGLTSRPSCARIVWMDATRDMEAMCATPPS